ncbi:energy transducer TonB [Piscinibacter sakaiensis]|uniref:energy transducer TonB n=1 Tax=Piscinibacter sakaiensis TaxID=1547922 RepID=UPI003AAE3890
MDFRKRPRLSDHSPDERYRRGGTIEFTIAEDGTTKDFVVVESDYRYFADHAIIALREWRYQPATKNGKPVAVRVRQTFEYVVRKPN